MNRIFLLILIIISLFTTARAELYLELAFESGGDELIATNFGESIDAGGGVKLAVGIRNQFGRQDNRDITMSLGYLFDRIGAVNGRAEFEVFSFDVIVNLSHRAPHRFGFGGSYHMNPRYDENVSGFAPLTLEFDDVLGFIFQYAYQPGNGPEIGLRYTDMNYEINNLSVDASSIGLFIGGSF